MRENNVYSVVVAVFVVIWLAVMTWASHSPLFGDG